MHGLRNDSHTSQRVNGTRQSRVWNQQSACIARLSARAGTPPRDQRCYGCTSRRDHRPARVGETEQGRAGSKIRESWVTREPEKLQIFMMDHREWNPWHRRALWRTGKECDRLGLEQEGWARRARERGGREFSVSLLLVTYGSFSGHTVNCTIRGYSVCSFPQRAICKSDQSRRHPPCNQLSFGHLGGAEGRWLRGMLLSKWTLFR